MKTSIAIRMAVFVAVMALATIVTFANPTVVVSNGAPVPLCNPNSGEDKCIPPQHLMEKAFILADGSDPMPLCRPTPNPRMPGSSGADTGVCSIWADHSGWVLADGEKPRANLVSSLPCPRGKGFDEGNCFGEALYGLAGWRADSSVQSQR